LDDGPAAADCPEHQGDQENRNTRKNTILAIPTAAVATAAL
jgi:hypothetical protein